VCLAVAMCAWGGRRCLGEEHAERAYEAIGKGHNWATKGARESGVWLSGGIACLVLLKKGYF